MDGANAAIRDHQQEGNELHVFEIQEGAWEVTYVGEYEYYNQHWPRLPDRNDQMRDAIRFELVPAGGREIAIETSNLNELPLEALREKAEESVTGGSTTTSQSMLRSRYTRSEVVKEYALRAADGVCQGCGNEAPFVDESGEPFLEVHHLHRRSDGGADHPNNVIALCPNCHRRVHCGRDGDEFNQELIERVRT